MERPITGFHRDDEQQWVAELSCGHGQHVRHRPPFVEREWVVTEEGRSQRLGAPLDCIRCDRRELPETFAPYQRTREFDEKTVPTGLLSRHDTKPGVWALIHVESGQLEYTIHEPIESREIVHRGAPAVVLPEIPHQIRPLGAVRFHIEFWRSEQ